MSKTRNEIIEGLYKAGKITFEEAMVLSSQSETPTELTLIEGVHGVPSAPISPVDELVNLAIEDLFNPDPDPDDPEIALGFNAEKVVALMKADDWNWVGYDEITPDAIKKVARSLVQDCVNTMKQDIEEDPERGYFRTYSETGGLRAEAEYDVKENDLEIRVMFVHEECSVFINKELSKRALC